MPLTKVFYELAEAFEKVGKAVEGLGMSTEIQPASMYAFTEDGELMWIAGSVIRVTQYDASTTLIIRNSQGCFELNLQPRQRQELIEALLDHHEQTT